MIRRRWIRLFEHWTFFVFHRPYAFVYHIYMYLNRIHKEMMHIYKISPVNKKMQGYME